MHSLPCLPASREDGRSMGGQEKVTVTRSTLPSICTPDVFLTAMMVYKTVNTHHNNKGHPVYSVYMLHSVQTT